MLIILLLFHNDSLAPLRPGHLRRRYHSGVLIRPRKLVHKRAVEIQCIFLNIGANVNGRRTDFQFLGLRIFFQGALNFIIILQVFQQLQPSPSL